MPIREQLFGSILEVEGRKALIWGSSTVDPRWMATTPTRPWDETEPIHKVHTCDSQENINVCLNCELKKCVPGSLKCPFTKNGTTRMNRTKKERDELDKRVKEMLYAGWRSEKLRKELNISESTYKDVRRRLKAKGELVDGRTSVVSNRKKQ